MIKLEELKSELAKLTQQITNYEKQEQSKFPKWGNTYFYIISDGLIYSAVWHDDDIDLQRQSIGDVYETELDAQRVLCQLKLNQKLIEMGGRQNFEYGNDNYFIEYDHDGEYLCADCLITSQIPNIIYFNSNELAEQAIETYESALFFAMGISDEVVEL